MDNRKLPREAPSTQMKSRTRKMNLREQPGPWFSGGAAETPQLRWEICPQDTISRATPQIWPLWKEWQEKASCEKAMWGDTAKHVGKKVLWSA
ncbi:unnamed protein product [Pleuronectes platessa]|uniref:Uncharacterized protein n=1 Tax=Pleuronectes platessa TaxID=8262 RepID=A0A9N7UZM7_PLEPL|nr:unnamed protein product [Pleuronectes platessa]